MSIFQNNLDLLDSMKNPAEKNRAIRGMCEDLLIRLARLNRMEAKVYVTWCFSRRLLYDGAAVEVLRLVMKEAERKIEKCKAPVMEMLKQYLKRESYSIIYEYDFEITISDILEDNKRRGKALKQGIVYVDRNGVVWRPDVVSEPNCYATRHLFENQDVAYMITDTGSFRRRYRR